MAEQREHLPVLFESVIEYLAPRSGGMYIDGTLGAGGHASGILSRSSPDGRLLGLDADPQALRVASAYLAQWGERVVLRHSNFRLMKQVAEQTGFVNVDGTILDLGLSSMQLADMGRGFSFQSDSKLDMRFDPTGTVTASDLVNDVSERELADLIYEFGEEHASRRIARAIVNARPIESATQLAEVIERALERHSRVHPATRTFQALRIEVNQELQALEEVLPQLVQLLAPRGRVVIITFHSLEDRIVKNFLRSQPELAVLTKHPVNPTRSEVLTNPRSRSAKLRAAERIAESGKG